MSNAPIDQPAPPGPSGEETTASSESDLHGCPVTEFSGQRTVHVDVARYQSLMAALLADGFEMLIGVTGVDYLAHPGRDLPGSVAAQRFEVVVELLSLTRHQRIRVRCQVPTENPEVPTLFHLWPGSDAHERETYDMFGIRFAGHPDLTRILMPEDWEGHPLRKDYQTGRVPVQFKESPDAR